jgi:hypothetical protein
MIMWIFSGDQQKEPMHSGEVFSVWSYALAAQGTLSVYQTYLNSTGDQDLQNFLQDTIRNVIQPEIEQTTQLLKENGVSLPPAPPERPKVNLEEIPPGARFNDPEIASILSMDYAGGLVVCSQVMGLCTREDIAAMFGAFHMNKAKYAGQLLKLKKEKGWLVMPPLQVKQTQTTH